MRRAAIAWLITAVYYFYQYTLRSAPAVMMPQLSAAFGLSAAGGRFAARVVLLRLFTVQSSSPARRWIAWVRSASSRSAPPAVGIGALLFSTGSSQAAAIGRLLQGAGGVFALVGAAYIATTNFPASRAATLIGATQMFGMAGGSAGQFVVGPLIASGMAWTTFWFGMGIGGLVISVLPVCAAARAGRCRTARQVVARGDRCHGTRLPQSAIESMRHDRGFTVHPDDHLRHGVGCSVPAGRNRYRLRRGRAPVGHSAIRLDHRLSAARVRLGSHRPAQAGDRG
jgi:MFS family permease